MMKEMLKELISRLTEEQQQSLMEIAALRESQETQVPEQYDIAIIGISGRYPQAAHHYDFWHKLQQGANFIREVPGERWDHWQYYDPTLRKSFTPYKTCCKFGAFLKDYDHFDAAFFEVRPDEVYAMDPQERLALETTWSCIEDAGYTPHGLGSEVGVFSGVTYGEYQKLIPISSHSFMLNNRIAYFFNFRGPAITTDAGCCSSLTAIHLACQSLRRNECQAAIVVGTNVILHPDHYSSTLLSPTTEPFSNPFGRDDGWIPAEGVVSILLKPLSRAVRDRDQIYAVIQSSHISQEGKTSWFGAFNPKQQAKLIQTNFQKSGIHPETIRYVEAAANGSSLGDAIEMDGLTTAFQQFTDKKQFCPIGTVKSNIGHGEGVSTLLQLTKVLLQFKSRTLLPLLHLEETNPNINMVNSPFYFQQCLEKWEPLTIRINEEQFTLPLRATISSFGAGGSIGHLILEEYIPAKTEKPALKNYFIPLSAKTSAQLKQTITGYLEFFEHYLTFDSEWEANYNLFNIMFTLCMGRVAFEERVAVIADTLPALMKKLSQWLRGEEAPDIITGHCGSGSLKKENLQTEAQSYLENQSWRDLAALWVRGLEIPWETFFKPYNVQRISLPTYCFQQQPFPIPKPVLAKFASDSGAIKTRPNIEKLNSASHIKNIPQNQVKKRGAAQRLVPEINPIISEVFREAYGNIIHIPAQQIDVTVPFESYGIDSAIIVNLANRLETYFKNVPKTLFFECETLQDVIKYFMNHYPEEIQNIISQKTKLASGEPAPPLLRPAPREQRIETNEESSGDFDGDFSVGQLTKEILSNRISKETVLQKL